MHATLLTTKLYVPPPCPTLILRPRLTIALSNALTRCLTLVSAPAGYGKTTLVSNWLQTLTPGPSPTEGEKEVGVRAAWLSLDEGDNDPIRFLQYFLSALQKTVPTLGVDLMGVVQGMQPAQFDALMSLLVNEIAEGAAPFVLVLDDFHVICAQPILEMLAFLLEHMPPQMHLVLLSRTDLPLPLARLRARNQLVEIREDQLRFTLDEITVFLNEVMGLALSADDIMAMEARTEGWVAGLQLAALSMQGLTDLHRFVSAFTGSHYYIMDYLAEEVLKLQPERVRSFLLQTSILDRMCGPLCDAVSGISNQPGPCRDGAPHGSGGAGNQGLSSDLASSHHLMPDPPFPGSPTPDAQPLLEYLERANLFLISLDDERYWYRYHHLFSDMLKRRLELLFPYQLPELHQRASQWYEQNGFISEAIQHALLAKDRHRATQLVEQNGCHLIMRGEVVTLLKWVEAVESHSRTHPWLAIQKAWALALTGRLEQVEPTLQAAEHIISSLEPTIEVRIMLGTMAAARAHAANLQGEPRLAADFARQALEFLPDSDPFSRSIRSVATSVLGDASWMSGKLEEAEHAYTQALHISRLADNVHIAIITSSALADILVQRGRLHQASRIYSETLQMATRPDGQRSPLADRLYAGLSRVSYEWNRLEAAAQYAHECVELCRQWRNFDLLAVGYLMLARLGHAQGHPEQARAAMQAAQQLASEDRLTPRRSIWVKSALACLWVVHGNLERASHFVQQSGITSDDPVPYLRETEYLTLLRLLLAQGNQNAALALSGRLLQQAQATHHMGRVIEILVLQALAFQGKKELVQALAVLERAIALAQPEGYVRVFLDEGEPMAKLLYQARSHQMGSGYAAELLYVMGSASCTTKPPAQLLIEPLSQRELEVLKLIEAGHSNQEIAAKLVISIATVKRHISNIYAKLGVKSRTQAVSLGKELSLFE